MVITMSVDDMAVTSWHLHHILEFKDQLRKFFKISDLGELNWLLGLKVEWDRGARTITLSQKAYIDTILKHFSLTDPKSATIPLEVRSTLSIEQSPDTHTALTDMQEVPYQYGIRSLMYTAMSMRPNISSTVTTLSQFMHNPGRVHWEAAKHTTSMHYLKGSGKKFSICNYLLKNSTISLPPQLPFTATIKQPSC